MKRYSLLLKFLAFVLATVCFLSALFCGYGMISLVEANLYRRYPDSLAQAWGYNIGQKRASSAATYYAATTIGNCPKELVEAIYEGTGYYGGSFVSIRKDGEEVYATGDLIHDGIVIDYRLTFDCPILVTDPPTQPDETPDKQAESDSTNAIIYEKDVLIDGQRTTYQYYYKEVQFDATVTLDQSLLNNTNYQLLSWLFPYRYALIWGLAFSLIGGIALVVYLMWAAGHDRGGQLELIGLNRLPLDVYLLGVALLFFLFMQIFYAIFDTIYSFHVLVMILLSIVLFVPLLLGFFYILAAQSKQKGGYWWHHTLLGRALRLCLKGLRALFGMWSATWQWLCIGGAMALCVVGSLLLSIFQGEPIFKFLFLLSCLGSLAMICYGGYCFGLLLTGARKMAGGDLEHQIPDRYLFGAFRTCAQQLNTLSDAANTAMQSQIRSERMKTELITNVSHDIKTPLTSIINFVDLLEKPHSQTDGKQYLEVLSSQSLRLKKLIEDLMELSKANSGNISVNLEALDGVEFVNQALGEFSDKLDNAHLTTVFRGPSEPLYIRADGRLLWRVLSNLLSNAVKYAAHGSRVYVDLTDGEERVQLSIRNISATEFHCSAEELLERFVRGDASRNTEGSGLGLNIAKSLTEIQQGTFDLLLDGDLFKVTLSFPKS